MKRYILRALALLLLVAVTVNLCACASLLDGDLLGGNLFGKGDEDENSGVKDKYGYARPELCWMTENMLFTEQPALTDLVGTAGENGMANEQILESEGRVLPGQENYLACVYFGSLPYTDMQLVPYLEFTVVNGSQILRGNECVEDVSVISWSGDLHPYVTMRDDANRRLSFDNPGKNEMQGVFVIEFTPKVSEGMLIVELCMELDRSYIEGVPDPMVAFEQMGDNYKLDYQDIVMIGTNSSDAPVYMSLTTSYLTEKAYNDGDFSDQDFIYYPDFSDSQYCYLVVDYHLMATKDGYGNDKVQIIVYLPERGGLDLYLERASTSETEKVTINRGMAISATVRVPDTIEDTKQGRIVVRLNALGSDTSELGVLAYKNAYDKIDGIPYTRLSVTPMTALLNYTLSTNSGFYVVSCAKGASPVSVEIADVLYGDVPVRTVSASAFENCATLESVVLGKNIQHIGYFAFAGCKNLASITFSGTVEEWNAIQKDSAWNQGIKAKQVVCADGTVDL